MGLEDSAGHDARAVSAGPTTSEAPPRPTILLPPVLDGSPEEFDPLLRALKESVAPLSHETEFAAWNELPVCYGIGSEVVRIKRTVDWAGVPAVDLLGVGGGAAIAVAFAMRYPKRVGSLGLIESLGFLRALTAELDVAEEDAAVVDPARWSDETALEVLVRRTVDPSLSSEVYRRLLALTREHRLAVPKARAFLRALEEYPADLHLLRQVTAPVYLAWGSLSNPVWVRAHRALTERFPRSRTHEFPGRHTFDPPHRSEPERVAEDLISMWSEPRPKAA